MKKQFVEKAITLNKAKYSWIFISLILMLNINLLLSEEVKQTASYDQAARWIKLGNSYRILESYDYAKHFIEKGTNLAIKQKNKYWEASGYESLAYLYMDNGDIPNAIAYFKKAYEIFKTKIKMEGGSQEVLLLQIARLEQGIISNKDVEIKNMQKIIDDLTIKVNDLQKIIDELQNKLNTISNPGPSNVSQ